MDDQTTDLSLKTPKLPCHRRASRRGLEWVALQRRAPKQKVKRRVKISQISISRLRTTSRLIYSSTHLIVVSCLNFTFLSTDQARDNRWDNQTLGGFDICISCYDLTFFSADQAWDDGWNDETLGSLEVFVSGCDLTFLSADETGDDGRNDETFGCHLEG